MPKPLCWSACVIFSDKLINWVMYPFSYRERDFRALPYHASASCVPPAMPVGARRKETGAYDGLATGEAHESTPLGLPLAGQWSVAWSSAVESPTLTQRQRGACHAASHPQSGYP